MTAARPNGSFRDLSVDEIARAAGISRSAFFTHFRDKHDLLLAAVADASEDLYRIADRRWQGTGCRTSCRIRSGHQVA